MSERDDILIDAPGYVRDSANKRPDGTLYTNIPIESGKGIVQNYEAATKDRPSGRMTMAKVSSSHGEIGNI